MGTPTPGLMAPADFAGRFAGLLGERASYRLETLDVYHDPSEEDDFQRFRDYGEPVRRTQWWYDHVRRSLGGGKVMARVHVVSEPLTAYLRFEIAAYLVNGAAAGEDVRILPRPHANALGLPTFDYWLMDSKIAYVLSYDDSGVMTQVEARTSPAFIRDCCRWRDDALRAAIPVRDYMTTTMRRETAC